MKKRILITIAAGFLAQEVWASEEAPYVGGQSTFSCNQVNTSIAMGGVDTARNMIRSALQQLDAAYDDDTDISYYYHTYVRDVGDYMARYEQKLIATCTLHPDQALTDAATDALNKSYEEHKTIARLAMCASYNSSDVTHEMILNEIRTPSVMSYTPDNIKEQVARVYNSQKYGEQYIIDGVSKYCDQNPRARLWTTYGAATNDAYNDLNAMEATERQAAVDKVHNERSALDLATYGVSLTNKGDASCRDLNVQIEHAQLDEAPDKPFVNGLSATLNAIADPLRDYERSAFDKAISESLINFAVEIYRSCGIYSDGVADLHGALMRTETITQASKNGFKDLEPTDVLIELSVTLDQEQNCEPNYTCEEQSYAATEARMAMTACFEKTAEDGQLCFVDPMDAFHYHLAFNAAERLSIDHNKLESTAKAGIPPNSLEPELSVCKNKAVDEGLRGDAYRKHIQLVCVPPLEAKMRAPILKQLTDVDSKLKIAQKSLEQLKSKGVAYKSI